MDVTLFFGTMVFVRATARQGIVLPGPCGTIAIRWIDPCDCHGVIHDEDASFMSPEGLMILLARRSLVMHPPIYPLVYN